MCDSNGSAAPPDASLRNCRRAWSMIPLLMRISGTAARLLRQPLDPCRERIDDGLGLLRDERVAGVGDHGYADPIPKFILHLIARGLWLERILCGLQVEQRRASTRPPFRLADSRGGGPLTVADIGMPPSEPDRRIIARRKEREPQRRKAPFLRQ